MLACRQLSVDKQGYAFGPGSYYSPGDCFSAVRTDLFVCVQSLPCDLF